MPPITVTQLVEVINVTLSQLEDVEVEGEVDEFKIIHNKWVTFQLKDEQSNIGCFMTVWQYKTAVEDGMLVRVKGRPTLRNKGFFSFVVSHIQPSGEGALKRTFELLRERLTQEGLFAPERKRPLPRFPEHIALITSRDAAAYSDFIKVLQARQGGLTISFLHTQVQGEDAPRQLLAALEYANTHLENIDAIVMVRGGGSLEDLQAFNDETIIRAVASSRAPIVVGVGHERDITLAELAADIRASTPSNAAELLVRSREELVLGLRQFETALHYSVQNYLQHLRSHIVRSVNLLRARAKLPQEKVARQIESLNALRQRIDHTTAARHDAISVHQTSLRQHFRDTLRRQETSTKHLERILSSLSPEKTLRRGYSITRNKKGIVIKAAAQLAHGDSMTTQFADGTIKSTVTGTDSQKTLAL